MTSPDPDAESPLMPSPWALEYAREHGASSHAIPEGNVEVELVTDPFSVWCWGFEPVRRALEHRYPSVTFRPLVGGMFARLPDPEAIGFDVERFFSVVQRTTGMPLRIDATRRDRPSSTYPACIHVAAVRLLRPDLENAYLRRLREAVYLDARNVSRPDVAADVAAALGVPREEFFEALGSGEPEREFRSVLGRLHAQDIHGYPTLLVRWGERVARIEGFQSLPGLLAAIEGATGHKHPATPAPPVGALLADGDRVATREIAEALGGSVESAYDELRALEAEGAIVRERLANGDVWRVR